MAFPRLALILGLVLAAGLLFFLLLPYARSEAALVMVIGLAVVAVPLIIAAAPKRPPPEEREDDLDDARPISCCGPRPVGEATRRVETRQCNCE